MPVNTDTLVALFLYGKVLLASGTPVSRSAAESLIYQVIDMGSWIPRKLLHKVEVRPLAITSEIYYDAALYPKGPQASSFC
jgi:hypothetical protein